MNYSNRVLISGITVAIVSLFILQATKNTVSFPQNPAIIAKSIPSPIFAVLGKQTVPSLQTFLVTRVIDGDTIEIEGGKKVRYIGINTPETVDPRRPVQCFGKEASAKNKDLVLGKRVGLEKDISETDKYGRLLRYVWIENILVNESLVKNGFAYSSAYPPDIKRQELFDQEQREAMQHGMGLWSACAGSTSSKVVQSMVKESGQTRTECVIKGNINSMGVKIYHLPGCGSYIKTTIDVNRGERMFCSEQEAQDAGWHKADNC